MRVHTVLEEMRATHKGQMREGLGKIAELSLRARIVFLGEKPKIVPQFQHVPGSVGRYGRLAEKDLAFAETRGIGGSVRVKLQDEVRRRGAVKASVNRQDAVRTEGRVDQRKILERVGAGIRIARVVRRNAIIAQFDPEVPVIVNGICGKVAPDVSYT